MVLFFLALISVSVSSMPLPKSLHFFQSGIVDVEFVSCSSGWFRTQSSSDHSRFDLVVCLFGLIRSRPNQIAGPGPKSGPAWKSESRGPENGDSRWRRPNSDIYSQNHHFGLVYDMIYQFLGMEAKNYKFGMFCQQCHPSVASGDADIRPRNASRIHTCHFVYVVILSISPIWRIGETNPSTKTSRILFSIVMPTFGKSCRRPWLHGLKNQS